MHRVELRGRTGHRDGMMLLMLLQLMLLLLLLLSVKHDRLLWLLLRIDLYGATLKNQIRKVNIYVVKSARSEKKSLFRMCIVQFAATPMGCCFSLGSIVYCVDTRERLYRTYVTLSER